MNPNYAEKFYASTLDSVKAAYDVGRFLRGEEEWEHWRSDLRKAFTACLGGFPDAVPLDIRRGDVVRKKGYTRERIEITTEPGLVTPAYLLLPEGVSASTPTAVALHGHGYGVKDIVGLLPDGAERPEGERNYHADFAVSLVQRGFAVIAPELLGFGELRLVRDLDDKNPGASSCNAISSMLLMVGRTMAGVRVQQAMRCIDVLPELGFAKPPVAMGISGGGLVCSYLTALDDRIIAACVSGYSNTYRGCIFAMHHCIDNYQPGLLAYAEMPDIFSLIAPRPMLWESGTRDPIFPIEHVHAAREIVQSVYDAHGAGECFEQDIFDGEHQISGQVAYDFLWKYAHA